jgi:hypothetical protein
MGRQLGVRLQQDIHIRLLHYIFNGFGGTEQVCGQTISRRAVIEIMRG